MDSISDLTKKSMYPVQVHIVHSLTRMIRGRLVLLSWMSPKDIIAANGTIFERMAESIQKYYDTECSAECLEDGIKLFIANTDKIPEKAPVPDMDRAKGEDTFWQDYERMVRLGK